MQQQIENHIFTGMQKDISPLKHSSSMLSDAHNIRIVPIEEGTGFSITNERGTLQCNFNLKLYIGHCILEPYIVVFATYATVKKSVQGDGPDFIILIERKEGLDADGNIVESYSSNTLYTGNLKFDVKHPIETLGIYESDVIQKVYWTDGINQPRVINIVKHKLLQLDKPLTTIADVAKTYNDTSFDFIPSMSLAETLQVTRKEGNGVFAPGTIQYAISYYNKYGGETNLVAVSPLSYISFEDRAGSPEERVSNVFDVAIRDIDTSFDYLRLYSIHRTSIDATSVCRKVVDVKTKIANTTEVETITEHNVVTPAHLYVGESTPESTNFERSAYWILHIGSARYDISDAKKNFYNNIVKDHLGFTNTEWLRFNKEDYPNFWLEVFDQVGTMSDGTIYTTSPKIITFNSNSKKDIYISLSKIQGGPSSKSDPTYIVVSSSFSVGDYSLYTAQGIDYRWVEAETTEVTKTVEVKKYHIIDNGTIGETIDPSTLLYVGGELITANSITQKDNTLFLAGITLTRPAVSSELKFYARNLDIDLQQTKISLPTSITTGYYSYSNQLSLGSTSYFKTGETYRFGFQAQHKTGKWSEPIFIKDMLVAPREAGMLVYPTLEDGVLTINNPSVTIPASIVDALKALGYVKVRPLVVFPTLEERTIITQGVLCPTVFNVKARKTNAPFAQSSWFLRPNLPTEVTRFPDLLSPISNNGSIVEFRHHYSLPASNIVGPSEIEGTENQYVGFANNNITDDLFFIDQSIVTMHSPDIEWDDGLAAINNKQLKCRIVGLAEFRSSVGQMDLQLTTPSRSKLAKFTIENTPYGITTQTPTDTIITSPARSLVSGPFYKDVVYKKAEDSDSESPQPWQEADLSGHYMLYPWQKVGSINNSGGDSAVLGKKRLCNLKFSTTKYIGTYEFNNGITPIQYVDTDQVTLTKIAQPKNSSLTQGISYYSNVDTLISNGSQSDYVANLNDTRTTSVINTKLVGNNAVIDEAIRDNPALSRKENGVRIKYKSSKHLVFAFNYTNTGGQVILPSINNLNKIIDTSYPFWLAQLSSEATTGGGYIWHYNITTSDTFPATVDASNVAIRSVGDRVLIMSEKYQGLWRLTKFYNSREGNWPPEKLVRGEFWEKEDIVTNDYLHRIGTDEWLQVDSYGNFVNSSVGDPTYEGATISQDNISPNDSPKLPYLFIAELYRDNVTNRFGGTSEEALQSNLWQIAGQEVGLLNSSDATIVFTEGDTWFGRYDCLKTYPFSNDDINQVIEIGSFMLESKVNPDGRYDRNRGLINNLNVNNTNFNLYNPVYNQSDNYFTYRILDSDFYGLNTFPNQVTWTKEKTLTEQVDTWTNVTLTSTLDMDGTRGKIVSLDVFNDNIYCFQEKGISNILFNSRVQIPTSEGVPIEISNSYKVDGKRYITNDIGCQDKWSIQVTPRSIYFIDGNKKALYSWNGESITNISETSYMSSWFRDATYNKWDSLDKKGFRIFYDSGLQDLYITNKDICLCYNEQLQSFTSFYDYKDVGAMFNISGDFYSIETSKSTERDSYTLWKHYAGDYNTLYGKVVPNSISFISNGLDNKQSTLDKVFTNLDYRMDVFKTKDIPDYSTTNESFDTIRVTNEYQDTGTVRLTTKRLVNGNSSSNHSSNLKKKFRTWHIDIPRNKFDKDNISTTGRRDRIRNQWCEITLTRNNMGFGTLEDQYGRDNKFIMHDINSYYYI